MMSYQNGQAQECRVNRDALDKIVESHMHTQEILAHTQYLRHLEVLPEIKESLLNAAIGKNHVDAATHKLIVRTLCACFSGMITVLVIIIGFLLTGEKMGLIGALHR